MFNLAQDFRIAVRNLWQHRGVSGFIALSVALAIAGNATVFSIVGAMMLRPFPYHDPERLVFFWDTARNQPDDQSPISPANFIDLKARARSFSQIEAFAQRSFSLTGGDRPEEVQAVRTTPGGLKLLGYEPVLGRNLRAEEGSAGRERVAILAHSLWKKSFGGDPRIVGKTIQLDDESYTVIGVLPPKVEFLTSDVGVWVPLVLDAKPSRAERSLLVMCTAFRGKAEAYQNLTIKKIPKTVLSRCEWGHDDYSLEVANLAPAPPPSGRRSPPPGNGARAGASDATSGIG